MKTITELLSVFNSRLQHRANFVGVFLNATKLISGAVISSKDFVFNGKKVVLGAKISGPIKTAIILKKKEIIDEMNKTIDFNIRDIC